MPGSKMWSTKISGLRASVGFLGRTLVLHAGPVSGDVDVDFKLPGRTSDYLGTLCGFKTLSLVPQIL